MVLDCGGLGGGEELIEGGGGGGQSGEGGRGRIFSSKLDGLLTMSVCPQLHSQEM